MKKPLRRHQSGYVLVLTLASLALMLIGATYVGQRVSDSQKLAFAERANLDAAFELEAARASVLYLISTQVRSAAGIGLPGNAIGLDGREYRIGEKVVVTLQDTRGLVALNDGFLASSRRQTLERLVESYGVPASKASQLVDTFLDYRDVDDLRRVNGAEKAEYLSLNRVNDLRNGNLLDSSELYRVFGWADAKDLWTDDPVINHVNVQRENFFNPNTATWRSLMAVVGIDRPTAQAMIARRQKESGIDLAGLLFGSGIGDPFGPLAFVNTFPGPALAVTLRKADMAWGYRMLVTQTPGEFASPWRISSERRMALAPRVGPVSDVPRLPESLLSAQPEIGAR